MRPNPLFPNVSHPAARRRRRFLRGAVVLLMAGVAFGGLAPARAEVGTGTILGLAFEDLNRDGVKQADERPLAGERIYLYASAGGYLANVLTDAGGNYRFADVASGAYRVEYGLADWWELWDDWAPSTTGTERPEVRIDVAASAVVDFGWRPIVRSTDLSAPISSYVGPDGLRVESFNDVVPARAVYDAIMAGSLHGDERARTLVRFDSATRDFCSSTVVSNPDGTVQSFSTGCNVTYLRWLDSGDPVLFHEYGHAWSAYYAHVVQRDPELLGYLAARGIDPSDPRLGTSHAWSRLEMIAEDYRQLFGSPTARLRGQENGDVPPAADVPGLAEYLSTTFMTPPPSGSMDTTPTAPAALHVADLDGVVSRAGRRWQAIVTSRVQDVAGNSVADATVSLTYTTTKGTTVAAACTTGPDGTCAVSVELGNKDSSLTLTVTDVAKDGTAYDGTANADPDGDSDGTSITVVKP